MASAVQLPVQFIQDDVREYRRERATLWYPCPRRSTLAVDHHPRLEVAVDQLDETTFGQMAIQPLGQSTVILHWRANRVTQLLL